jgi:hypothetical protein
MIEVISVTVFLMGANAPSGIVESAAYSDLPLKLHRNSCAFCRNKSWSGTHRINVLLVAATHRDLVHMVARKELRSDLYYRLNVFPVLVPPLRERRDDIFVVSLFDLFRTSGCFLDCALDRGSTPNSYASWRQSDKAGNFLRFLCRSHSGFVPLAYSRDGDACCCGGVMAYRAKAGFGSDARQTQTSVNVTQPRFKPSNRICCSSTFHPAITQRGG